MGAGRWCLMPDRSEARIRHERASASESWAQGGGASCRTAAKRGSGMSYDVTFVRRRPGQTWDEALRSAESGVVGPGAVEPPDEAVWSAIVTEARRIVGDVSVFDREGVRALDHVPTGIE